MDIKMMIKELSEINHINKAIPNDIKEQEAFYDALRTISIPSQLSGEYYKNEKEYILSKRADEKIINIDEITEQLIDNIYIYLGDITKIKTDAIVNAANEKLLGCFIPGHKCIDNAIHLAAGLRLRNACNDLMIVQGHDEPAGTAKITKGYNLPSKYVFHTVGPNVHKMRHITNNREKADLIKHQLAGCYNSILKLADDYEDIKNICFCSISTGVYGVPISFASRIAIETIQAYLNNNKHHLDKIVINVFSQEDYNEYKKQAKQVRNS